jgi:hypothetical protein
MGRFDDGLRRGKEVCRHARNRVVVRMAFCNLPLVRGARNPLVVGRAYPGLDALGNGAGGKDRSGFDRSEF